MRALCAVFLLVAVLGLVRGFTLATTNERLYRTPTFFMIGVTKSGTSSLAHHLMQHPDMRPSTCKPDPDHFCNGKELDFFASEAYDRGLDWYRSNFPNGTGFFTMDATPHYFYRKDAMERLEEYLTNEKLIVMVRNPVDRAYSQWRMLQRFQKSAPIGVKILEHWKLGFEDAINAELGAIDAACGTPPTPATDREYTRCLMNVSFEHEQEWGISLVVPGVYHAFLAWWYERFPRSQILVVDIEDMTLDPKATLDRVTDFVGLRRFVKYPDATKMYNTAEQAGDKYVRLQGPVRARLQQFYHHHNVEFYDMIGRDLGWNPRAPGSIMNMVPGIQELGLRIFIYALPERFHPVSNMGSYWYCAAERAVAMRIGDGLPLIKVTDPAQAQLFYVPAFFTAPVFARSNSKEARETARSMVLEVISYINSIAPHWSARGGADHVFAFTYDQGICMDHASFRAEESELARKVTRLLNNSIVLSSLGDLDSPCFHKSSNIVIPPTLEGKLDNRYVPLDYRKTLVHFRGKVNELKDGIMWDPEELGYMKSRGLVIGQHYSHGVRAKLMDMFSGRPGWVVSDGMISRGAYLEEMRNSVFCIAPRGYAGWSVRLYEALMSRCIPVIIADNTLLPFERFIDWTEFSVRVAESDLDKLPSTLEGMSQTRRKSMFESLEYYRKWLLYNPDANQYTVDAMYWILRELDLKARTLKSSELLSGASSNERRKKKLPV